MTGEPSDGSAGRPWPLLSWIPGYHRSWLRPDVVAGLTVCAILVPEGMAYAQLAGMPAETAFYAAPIALLAYAVAYALRSEGAEDRVAVLTELLAYIRERAARPETSADAVEVLVSLEERLLLELAVAGGQGDPAASS